MRKKRERWLWLIPIVLLVGLSAYFFVQESFFGWYFCDYGICSPNGVDDISYQQARAKCIALRQERIAAGETCTDCYLRNRWASSFGGQVKEVYTECYPAQDNKCVVPETKRFCDVSSSGVPMFITHSIKDAAACANAVPPNCGSCNLVINSKYCGECQSCSPSAGCYDDPAKCSTPTPPSTTTTVPTSTTTTVSDDSSTSEQNEAECDGVVVNGKCVKSSELSLYIIAGIAAVMGLALAIVIVKKNIKGKRKKR